MQDFETLSAGQISAGIGTKYRASAICREAMTRAETIGKKLNAFITLMGEKAFVIADELDNERSDTISKRLLTGVPVALKDNICLKDNPTTCGSKHLENFIPPYNATAAQKLLDAGGVVIGKNNMDEFAMGSSNEHSFYGPALNPIDNDYVPGGSSGGSAAAVAAGIVPIALGSDTGGSVRQPASFCGVYGLRPTYGAVSRYGLIAFASSMDQIGPIARNVYDLALVYSIIAGYDPKDSTSIDFDHPEYYKKINTNRKFKIGIPVELISEITDKETTELFEKVIAVLKSDGHTITEISVPTSAMANAVYYIIAKAEASSNLARYDGVGYGFRSESDNYWSQLTETRTKGFGVEAKRRILTGAYILSAGYYDRYYSTALKAKKRIQVDFHNAFQKLDLLVTPTSPTPPFKLGEKVNDPMRMYLSDILTTPASVGSIPAISVPFGSSRTGLPIGMQFMADRFGEEKLFQIARRLEMINEDKDAIR